MLWLLLAGCVTGEDVSARVDADEDGFVAVASGGDDCDDGDPQVNPARQERCDGLDTDCNGQVEDNPSDGQTWFVDGDGDGVGSVAVVACDRPPNTVGVDGDCDDSDPEVFPLAPEKCDLVDQDCDGEVDEGLETIEVYLDADGDGFGIPEAMSSACAAFEGFSEQAGDCDDADNEVHPGADEVPFDGVDNDCDGKESHDADGDGEDALLVGGTDCDDEDSTVGALQLEICNDGVDNDCVDDDAVCQDQGEVALAGALAIGWDTTVQYEELVPLPAVDGVSYVLANWVDGAELLAFDPGEVSPRLVESIAVPFEGVVSLKGAPSTFAALKADGTVCGFRATDAGLVDLGCAAVPQTNGGDWVLAQGCSDTLYLSNTERIYAFNPLVSGFSAVSEVATLPFGGPPGTLVVRAVSGVERLYARSAGDGADFYWAESGQLSSWAAATPEVPCCGLTMTMAPAEFGSEAIVAARYEGQAPSDVVLSVLQADPLVQPVERDWLILPDGHVGLTPELAVADVNADGLDDLFVSSGWTSGGYLYLGGLGASVDTSSWAVSYAPDGTETPLWAVLPEPGAGIVIGRVDSSGTRLSRRFVGGQ